MDSESYYFLSIAAAKDASPACPVLAIVARRARFFVEPLAHGLCRRAGARNGLLVQTEPPHGAVGVSVEGDRDRDDDDRDRDDEDRDRDDDDRDRDDATTVTATTRRP